MNNASRLGPSPQPALRSYPLAELGQVYQTNVLAPLALIQLLAGPLTAGRRRGRQRQLGRGHRGLPRVGRLRLGQGRARPAHRGPRRRGARAALLRVRPRRHAHRHAPARLPRRGHLGPTGAGGRRRGPAAAARPASRPAAATGPATYPAGCRRVTRSGPAVPRPAVARPEARGLARDGVRLLAATPGRPAARPFRDLPRFPGPRRPPGRQHPATLAAASPASRPAARGDRAPLQPARRRDLAGRAPEGPAGAGPGHGRGARRDHHAPRGGSVTLLHPYPDRGPRRGAGPALDARSLRGPSAEYLARHGSRSATPTSRTDGHCRPTRRCSPAPPAARRCPAQARPFTRELVTGLIARRGDGTDHPAHRGGIPGGG